MKLSILGKFLLIFLVVSAWLNFCGAIMQSRLHYERNGQIDIFFCKKKGWKQRKKTQGWRTEERQIKVLEEN
jgi:hypothetical protein